MRKASQLKASCEELNVIFLLFRIISWDLWEILMDIKEIKNSWNNNFKNKDNIQINLLSKLLY